MDKNNIHIFISLISFILLNFLFAQDAKADVLTGGLWGQYSKGISNSTLMEVKTENLDHDNFDEVLLDRIGQKTNAEVIWTGAIHADYTGNYDFRVDTVSSSTYLKINGMVIMNYVKGDRLARGVSLKKGWNNIYIRSLVREDDSMIRLFWKQPNQDEEIIPANKLSYNFWSNTTVTIPKNGKEKMDYLTGGVGARDLESPEIHLDLGAANVSLDDVLKEDVWITWYMRKEDPPALDVENIMTGESLRVNGNVLSTELGTAVYYDEAYANLPKALIETDSSKMLKLSFRKPAGATDQAFFDGIGIIVPYRDDSKPEGKISLRMIGGSAYHGASPVLIFPTQEIINNQINPVFIFGNGETKTVAPGKYRPNYLVMLSGESGSEPAVDATLKKMKNSKIIVPKSSPLKYAGDPDTWYPSYGREGEQFDVISSRYLPNQWNHTKSQYLNSGEGKMAPISIPPSHDWVAFQYYGSNFAEDGVDGSGESSTFSGGGLFSTKGLDEQEYDLDVIASGNGKVDSSPIGIDCPSDCNEKYLQGTNVKLHAKPNGTSLFIRWEGDCTGTNTTCNLVMDSNKTVYAKFTVPGVCGPGNGGSFCSAPTNKCLLGVPINEKYDSSSRQWSWNCSHDGDLSNVCSASRSCNIIENNP